MSQGNLLNTQTPNFMGLVGNGKRYSVPPYQRDYSWTEAQWEDLWRDIIDLHSRPGSSHYMGAMVMEASSDQAFLIIDGQQRIATLSILALAIIHQLNSLADKGIDTEKNRERALQLRQDYISKKDSASLIEATKLKLNQYDDPFYQDYLVKFRSPQNPRGLKKSNSLMWKAFQWFQSTLEQWKESQDGHALATLLDRTIGKQLLFILITVQDEVSAYTVFETLNARGIELSSTDLIKNYLFSKTRVSTEIEHLQRRWAALLEIVKPEKFPEFLRYYLLCQYSELRKPDLFKLIRTRFTRLEDIFGLLEKLEDCAELYVALSQEEHEYWIDRPEAKPYIRELALFKITQMTPLLLVGYRQFPAADFVRLLKLVVAISFRFSVIGQSNPNKLESVYPAAARALSNSEQPRLGNVFKTLKTIYSDDQTFRDDFKIRAFKTTGSSKPIAKYILCKLEETISGKPCDWKTETGTIEHVLPQNLNEHWTGVVNPERYDQYVYRLGNLTLLEKSKNKLAGGKKFLEKQTLYQSSQYQLTQSLTGDQAPDEWTEATIEARQEWMAEIAARLWKADFEQS